MWTLGNPDRIRDRMNEQKDSEQTMWVSLLCSTSLRALEVDIDAIAH